MKNSVIMAFTRAEKPHLLLPNSRRCFVHVWRGVFFIATFLSHTQGGEWIQPCFGFLFLFHMTKTNYPWLFLPVDWFCLAGIASFFTFASTNIKNWAHGNILHWSRCPWDDAGMLREPVRTCGRLYERNRCKELGEWLDDQDVCLLLNISPYLAFFW